MAYKAGQFITIAIPYGNEMIQRCYSLSRAPNMVNGQLWVGVKRFPKGKGSNWLHDHVKKGDFITVSAPLGRFTLDQSKSNHLLFFAGGSGITPIMAMIESALTTGNQCLRLFYATKDGDNIIFKARLDSLKKQYGSRFTIYYHSNAVLGFAKEEHILEVINGYEEAKFYICGSNPLMDSVEKVAATALIPDGQIHVERFSGQEETLPSAFQGTRDGSETAVIHVNEIRYEVASVPGLSILKSAQTAGITVPSSCEDGYCGTCRAKVLNGEVSMVKNLALSDDDIANGWVLTCQSLVASKKVELTYDKVEKTDSGTTFFSRARIREHFSLRANMFYVIPSLLIGLFFATYLYTSPTHEEFLNPGDMTTGHENLGCVDCHENVKGTFRQNMQAITAHNLGWRKTSGDIVSEPVTSADCVSCHERENDRHPINRFNDPRFVKAIKTIDARECTTCHQEHTGQRAILKIEFCVACHKNLEVKNDPLDVNHATLIKEEKWETCLGCHDFHGNHERKTPTKLFERIDTLVILEYLKKGQDPYASEKIHPAKEKR
jgi:3-ketosteroid 9alpha-monooxygenase subunit B